MTYLERCVDSIRQRCYNTKHPQYTDYGGRGITCHWQRYGSRQEFIRWIVDNLGERPSPQHSIDRIDNEGNYEPGNLRWATKKEQIENRRELRSRKVWKWVYRSNCPGVSYSGQFRHRDTLYRVSSGDNPADVYLRVLSLRSLVVR